MGKKYLSIKGCEDDIDLRIISSRATFLRRIEKKYKMKNFDVVCFTNKTHTRFRLVLKIQGMTLMCIPEIEDTAKYSTYLKVNKALANLGGFSPAVVKLETLAEYTKDRIKKIDKRYRKLKIDPVKH